MDPGKIFQIITNSTLLATRLLSGPGSTGPLEFSSPRYCAILSEDVPVATSVVTVSATHKQGAAVRYSITGGNKEGLFTINQQSGVVTLAAPLDYEIRDKHEVVVGAIGGGEAAHVMLEVRVWDVNDNSPYFINPQPSVTVIEEDDRDLPISLAKVEARDVDRVDQHGLHYAVSGDGVDGLPPSDVYFTINSRTGELIQLRALDRDPPNGKSVWKVRVQVRDGQTVSYTKAILPPPPQHLRQSVLSHREEIEPLPQRLHQVDVDHLTENESSNLLQSPKLRDFKQQHSSQKIGSYSQDSQHQPQILTLVSRGSSALLTKKSGEDIDKDANKQRPRNYWQRFRFTKEHQASAKNDKKREIDYIPDVLTEQGTKDIQLAGTDKAQVHRDGEENTNSRNRKAVKTSSTSHSTSEHPSHKTYLRESKGGKGLVVVFHKRKPQLQNKNFGSFHGRAANDGRLPSVSWVSGDRASPSVIYSRKLRGSSGRLLHRRRARRMSSARSRAPYLSSSSSSRHHSETKAAFLDESRKHKSLSVFPTVPHPNQDGEKQYPDFEVSKIPSRRLKNFQEIELSADINDGVYPLTKRNENMKSPTEDRLSGLEYNSLKAESRRACHEGGLNDICNEDSKDGESHQRIPSKKINITRSKNDFSKSFPVSFWMSERKYIKMHDRSVSRKVGENKGKGLQYPSSKNFLTDEKEPEYVSDHAVSSASKSIDSISHKSNISTKNYSNPASNNPKFSVKGFYNNTFSSSRVFNKTVVESYPVHKTPSPKTTPSTDLINPTRRRKRAAGFPVYEDDWGDSKTTTTGGGCEDVATFARSSSDSSYEGEDETLERNGERPFVTGGRVHVVETVVTVLVKDINDNAPIFPNATMLAEVPENGPTDLSVLKVIAKDADESTEGTNAKLTYSIEKNVIDERSGEPIFTVDSDSGVVRTALCCLDRELTPEYYLQVVASDGGGLKGTGTVIVTLGDENDNGPRLARREWDLEVDESWGSDPQENATILEMAASDLDSNNFLYFRVAEDSGPGWQNFGVRTVGAVGQLYASKVLDYENKEHRRGFRFRVQVTDKGPGGWDDPKHLDSAWVGVKLRDLNDNPPRFSRPHDHITVREDASPGTLLANLPAHDPDMMKVEYRVVGAWDALAVDAGGSISLVHPLDREVPDGDEGVAKILAIDQGRPRLTATATLTITVTDVNDCPPTLLPPTTLHVAEDAPSTLLGVLTATDDDLWELGHGPPFNMTLSPTNPPYIFKQIRLKMDPLIDSGRGGAEVWTLGGLDREARPQLEVGVTVADAGGLAAVNTVTIIIDDINDNPMRAGAKTVYLWKTQGRGSDAPLGRVYVNDPDDWDVHDKTYAWAGKPHPLFSLDTHQGTVFASSQVREGRYDLQFMVSDERWQQAGVAGNVTVVVRVLPQEALTHAAPVTLIHTSPTHLTAGWTPTKGGGKLGRLVEAISHVVGPGRGEESHSVQVVSVYGHPNPPLTAPQLHHVASSDTHGPPTQSPAAVNGSPSDPPSPSTSVWVSVRDRRGGFMDPIKLQGLLALNAPQLSTAVNKSVVVGDPGGGGGKEGGDDGGIGGGGGVGGKGGGGKGSGGRPDQPPVITTLHHTARGEDDPASAASRASITLPLQVVDTNTTSLVTPHLTRRHDCHAHHVEPDSCTQTSCLNGGRCIRSHIGNRCICPGGSSGPRCKVLSRTFSGGGWAWVRPLPPCLPATMSLRLLTRRPDALVWYSGPLAPPPPHPSSAPPTPMMALQLKEGRPQLLLQGGGRPLKLEVNATLHDGDWHTLHLHFTHQGVTLMVDLCGRVSDATTDEDPHCLARGVWTSPKSVWTWVNSGPLQVGGLAHSSPRPEDHGWREAPTPHPLHGCVSHLTLNSQLVDLGEPSHSMGSVGGCKPQEGACQGGVGACGLRGTCVGGLVSPNCQCEPGWAGSHCTTPTVPAALGVSSYMKVALSFTPPTWEVALQLRIRTRTASTGLLVHLATQQQDVAFTVHLRSGVACAAVSGGWWVTPGVCLESHPLGDGAWHTLRAERYGQSLVVSVDDGDGWRTNESLALLTKEDEKTKQSRRPSRYPQVEKHDGVTVGGFPEFVGVDVTAVHEDLQDVCVDDLRISGRPLPLAPALNGTSWGQVTASDGVVEGCTAPDPCVNTTCAPPLTCTATWGHATCSCGPGRQLVERRCVDVDECIWSPCLHGGSCANLRPGYECHCGPGHAGDHCQWATVTFGGHPMAAPAAVAAITLSLLFLIVVGVVLSIRLHRHRSGLAVKEGSPSVAGGRRTSATETDSEIPEKGGGGTDEGGGSKQSEDTFFKCFLLKLPHKQTSVKEKKNKSKSKTSCEEIEMSVSGVAAPGLNCGPVTVTAPDPLLPKDDLRAYAYEGDGSSSGSFTSTLSGLRAEVSDELDIKSVAPGFLEVMDLLKNLPDATKRSPSVATVTSGTLVKDKKCVLKDTSSAKSGSPDFHMLAATIHSSAQKSS